MDKLIMDMLKQMNETMVNMNSTIQELQVTQQEMQKDMQMFRRTQVEMKQDIAEVKQTLDSLGEMFEHMVNIQGKEDNIMKTLRYLSHKVSEHDEAIFHLKNKK